MGGEITAGRDAPDNPGNESRAPVAATRWALGGASGPPPGAEGAVWHRYLASIRRYKWMVAAATVIGMGLGVAAARFVPPLYTAQATVWVQAPTQRPGQGADRGPIRQAELLTSAGWVDFLKSYVVLDPAIQRLQLYLTVEPPADSGLFVSFAL